MNKLTQEVIDKLAKSPDGKVVSIYLPTHRYPTAPHMTEDQTRFKNLLNQARSLVEADEGHNAELAERLNELDAKIDDTNFWRNTIESLAIFVSADEVQIYHLPFECEEYAVYADSYMIGPLIMLQTYNEKFYVLDLAIHKTKLYEADMYDMTEVDIDFPKDVVGAGNTHSVSSEDEPVGADDVGQQGRMLYFKAVDDALTAYEGFDLACPMVLAGGENDVRGFREQTSLRNVIPSSLEGDYARMSDSELHDLAWPLACRYVVDHKHQPVVEQTNDLQGSGKTSTQLDEIELAAIEGRVEALLVDLIGMTNDSVTDRTDEAPVVRLSSDRSQRLNQLVQLVSQFGGKVVGVDSQAMPSQPQVAALYRY